VHFCSRYLDGLETRLNRHGRNHEGDLHQLDKSKLKVFLQLGKPLHAKKYVEVNVVEQEQARNYVFQNCDEVSPFLE